MTAIRTCPFCGGTGVKRSYDRHGFLVICADCAAETAVFDSPKEAIEAWNRRTEEKDA